MASPGHNELNNQAYNLVTYVDGFVQDCRISIADTMEILQSCIKP